MLTLKRVLEKKSNIVFRSLHTVRLICWPLANSDSPSLWAKISP